MHSSLSVISEAEHTFHTVFQDHQYKVTNQPPHSPWLRSSLLNLVTLQRKSERHGCPIYWSIASVFLVHRRVSDVIIGSETAVSLRRVKKWQLAPSKCGHPCCRTSHLNTSGRSQSEQVETQQHVWGCDVTLKISPFLAFVMFIEFFSSKTSRPSVKFFFREIHFKSQWFFQLFCFRSLENAFCCNTSSGH